MERASWSGYDNTMASVTPHVGADEAPNYAQTPGPAGETADAHHKVILPGKVGLSVPTDGEHIALWAIVVGACVGLLLVGHGLNGLHA